MLQFIIGFLCGFAVTLAIFSLLLATKKEGEK